MLRFNENSFLIEYWDYKPTKTIHVDDSGVYTSEET